MRSGDQVLAPGPPEQQQRHERKRYNRPFRNLPSTPTTPRLLLSPTESQPHPHGAPSQRHATSRESAFYRSAGGTPQPPTARLPTDVVAHLPVRSSLSAPHLVARRGSRCHPRRLRCGVPDHAKQLRRVPRTAYPVWMDDRSNLQPASAGTRQRIHPERALEQLAPRYPARVSRGRQHARVRHQLRQQDVGGPVRPRRLQRYTASPPCARGLAPSPWRACASRG